MWAWSWGSPRFHKVNEGRTENELTHGQNRANVTGACTEYVLIHILWVDIAQISETWKADSRLTTDGSSPPRAVFLSHIFKMLNSEMLHVIKLSKSFLKIVSFIYVYMTVCIYVTCVSVLLEIRTGIRYPRAGITGGCEASVYGCVCLRVCMWMLRTPWGVSFLI